MRAAMDKASNFVISLCAAGYEASLITFASSEGRMRLWAAGGKHRDSG